jgi:multisubunit Na+/H+ antiporter MnhB subunit
MSVFTQSVARLLLLPIFVLALAVLVKGYTDTGDGFSAGVIAATAIMLQYLAFGYRTVEQRLPVRFAPALAFIGLLIALLVAFVPVLRRAAFFAHAPPPGGEVIHLGSLELHTAVVFDIGVFFLVLGFAVHTMSLIAQAFERRTS